MANRKNTKKALFTSAISLLLCFSMLIGTTFAWFTDSVSSNKNKIVAGNLDIELEYSDDMENWATVQGKSDLVDPNALWEPGRTEVVYLRISNLGSLALKYAFNLSFEDTVVGKSVLGNDIYLSEHLMYAVVDVTEKFDSRDEARKEVEDDAAHLTAYSFNGQMLAGDKAKTVALVIYMPEDVGNEANYRGEKIPQINMGVNLFATQYTYEEDSFNENYDKFSAAFTVAEANDLLKENKDVLLTNCNEPNGVVEVPTGYTGTLAVQNSSIKSIQAAGDVKIDILGKVVIDARGSGVSTFAAVNNFDGSAIGVNGKLTISGTGKLTAIAAEVNGAFGIGGMNATEITIKNITIDYVSGSYPYGVGTDTKYYKDAPEGGAAIGSGYDGAVITLENVTVSKAIGGSKAAGIGARYHVGVTVNIKNSIISYVEGGVSAAGVGGSRISSERTESGTTINIVNSSITAKGGTYGAGIGSGYDTHCNQYQPECTINITDSTITAVGGQYAAGVGTGYHHAALAGEIKNSTVTATSGAKIYKSEYTAAMDVGFGVVDPAREGATAGSILYNGKAITLSNAFYQIADGVLYNKVDTYQIYNANGMKYLADTVNQYSNYEYPYKDQTVLLTCDINLGGMEWTPIGDYRFSANRFCGTFDGQGHTISNFQITKKTDKNDSNKSSYGLFGNVEGTVKNLTVSNATVSSYAYCGALIGRLNNGLVENCHVVNASVAPSYWQGGIMIGQVNGGTVKNCTVSNSKITGKSALGGMFGPTTAENGDLLFENCIVKESAIVQAGSFGGSYDKYFGGLFGYVESGDNRVDINNCAVVNTTIKGELSALLSGDNDGGSIYFNGAKAITTAADLMTALNAGGNVVLGADIAMESMAIINANFVLDGNGYTITMAEGATNTYALFDISGGTATIKNVTFDGITGGAVVRTVNAKFNADKVTAKNGNHTQVQGLFRLLGESTITNCTFVNNTCNMVITLNYDSEYAAHQAVKNCVFENNTCNDTAVVYYVDGTGFTADGNEFVNNKVSTAGNGATLYIGFMEDTVITNNLFQGNAVTGTGISKRIAGALMIGYEAEITGNAFIDNVVNAANAKGNDVCASVYYTDIDLSGNYWGGSAPVENDDYMVEYTNHKVIINDYLTTYEA